MVFSSARHVKQSVTSRAATQANPNFIQTSCHVQDLILHSEVLVTRSIPHRANLDRDAFLRLFRSVKASGYRSRCHYANRHKELTKEWSRVMGTKSWPTFSEDSACVGPAALTRWCDFGKSFGCRHPDPNVWESHETRGFPTAACSENQII